MTVPDSVEATIIAENTFTDALELLAGETCTISVILTAFTGDVSILRQLPNQTTFQSITDSDGAAITFDTNVEFDYYATERQLLKLGVLTGAFAGTSAKCRLGKG